MDQRFEYTFIDGETNTSFDITLTPEEYARAEVDIEYATRLLEQSKKSLQPGPSTASTSMEIMDEESNESDGGSTFHWSDSATKCFLNLYQEYDKALGSGKITHKKVWEKMSEKMKQYNFNVTSKQCSTKLSSLKRMYKNVKDHNSKTGNDLRTWKYFELMEEIFATKPWVAPLSTTSSRSDDNLDFAEEPPKRRKVDTLLGQLLERKREDKEVKQQQHKEKMERLDKMNELLEKLVSKN